MVNLTTVSIAPEESDGKRSGSESSLSEGVEAGLDLAPFRKHAPNLGAQSARGPPLWQHRSRRFQLRETNEPMEADADRAAPDGLSLFCRKHSRSLWDRTCRYRRPLLVRRLELTGFSCSPARILQRP